MKYFQFPLPMVKIHCPYKIRWIHQAATQQDFFREDSIANRHNMSFVPMISHFFRVIGCHPGWTTTCGGVKIQCWILVVQSGGLEKAIGKVANKACNWTPYLSGIPALMALGHASQRLQSYPHFPRSKSHCTQYGKYIILCTVGFTPRKGVDMHIIVYSGKFIPSVETSWINFSHSSFRYCSCAKSDQF